MPLINRKWTCLPGEPVAVADEVVVLDVNVGAGVVGVDHGELGHGQGVEGEDGVRCEHVLTEDKSGLSGSRFQLLKRKGCVNSTSKMFR